MCVGGGWGGVSEAAWGEKGRCMLVCADLSINSLFCSWRQLRYLNLQNEAIFDTTIKVFSDRKQDVLSF